MIKEMLRSGFLLQRIIPLLRSNISNIPRPVTLHATKIRNFHSLQNVASTKFPISATYPASVHQSLLVPRSAVKFRIPKRTVTLYDKRTGNRGFDLDAVKRFKRLDWGMYVRHRAGRFKKRWKKTESHKLKLEQTVFCKPYHIRRFDMMFNDELKRKRYFPDDPYEKYNQMPFWRHLAQKRKNSELIKMYGNDVYLFDRWKAHLSKHKTKYNIVPKPMYEPPGYFDNINSGTKGVYEPEFVPKTTKAPHFKRRSIMNRLSRKEIKTLNDLEYYNGKMLKPWDPLIKKTKFWL